MARQPGSDRGDLFSSTSTVRCWFRRGRSYRRPTAVDLRHLALMDFLLEHFEQMPQDLVTALCPPQQDKTEA